ncbi:MAG: hypothetical protein ACT4PT_12430 [Methanobacteriota archaeon]
MTLRLFAIIGALVLLGLASPVPIPGLVLVVPVGADQAEGIAAVAGPAALSVAPGAVDFGTVLPGTSSEPVRLTLANTGSVPLRLALATPGLSGPDGASIPAAAIRVVLAEGDSGLPLAEAGTNLRGVTLGPGSETVLLVILDAPSGEDSDVPAGAYTGAIEVTARGVA